jgi:hypothetical protein
MHSAENAYFFFIVDFIDDFFIEPILPFTAGFLAEDILPILECILCEVILPVWAKPETASEETAMAITIVRIFILGFLGKRGQVPRATCTF